VEQIAVSTDVGFGGPRRFAPPTVNEPDHRLVDADHVCAAPAPRCAIHSRKRLEMNPKRTEEFAILRTVRLGAEPIIAGTTHPPS
jgi:hypothetical protein